MNNTVRIYLHSIVSLPSTIIHELLHALFVIIFTMSDIVFNSIRILFRVRIQPITIITSFNLLPDIKEGTLGLVSFKGHSPVQLIFISAAPLLSWGAILLILFYLEYFDYVNGDIVFQSFKLYRHEDILAVIPSYYLFKAGILSNKDIQNVFTGILSFQFFGLLVLLITLFYFDIAQVLLEWIKTFES